MDSQQRSESPKSVIIDPDHNKSISSSDDAPVRLSDLRKPPFLNSSGLSDLATTPPLQNITTFTYADGNQTCFDQIQNLPTPIVSKNENKLRSPMGSPISPTLRIPSNSGAFTISKVRNKNNHVLTESNAIKVTGNINERNNDTFDNFIDVPKQRINSSISSMMFMQNIRPVDRVVSLPLAPPKQKECNQIKAPLTEVNNYKPGDGPFSANLVDIVTFSTDEQRRPQTWHIAHEIGTGSFSKVYLEQGGQVASKITDVSLNKDEGNDSELKLRIQNSLIREIEILKSLCHPNIIRLIGSDYSSKERTEKIERIVMALEYCRGGDLFSFISERREEMSPSLIRCIFANIVSAVHHLHSNNICHRDLKPENILLKYTQLELLNNGVELYGKNVPLVVLSDFGLSKKIDNSNSLLSTRCGSEDYVSPELLLGMPYDGKQNDCWSLGVVLYTLLEARLPFDPLPTELNKLTGRKASPSHRIVMIMWSWFKVKEDPDGIFSEPKNIVKMLLCKRNKRATIQDIANTEWVKNI